MAKSGKKIRKIKELPSRKRVVREIQREGVSGTAKNDFWSFSEEKNESLLEGAEISAPLQRQSLSPPETPVRFERDEKNDKKENKHPYSAFGFENPKREEKYSTSAPPKREDMRESPSGDELKRQMENRELRQLRGDENPRAYAITESHQEKPKKRNPWV